MIELSHNDGTSERLDILLSGINVRLITGGIWTDRGIIARPTESALEMKTSYDSSDTRLEADDAKPSGVSISSRIRSAFLRHFPRRRAVQRLPFRIHWKAEKRARRRAGAEAGPRRAQQFQGGPFWKGRSLRKGRVGSVELRPHRKR